MKLTLERLWNFFALTGTPDSPEVCRVPVTADLQRDLSRVFAEQLTAFGLDESEHIEYDPNYRPEDSELLVVRGFALPSSIPDLTSAPDVPRLGDAHIDAGNVRALVGVPQGTRDNALLCFQAVDNRQLLRRERFSMFMSHDAFTRNERSGLVIRDSLTAVYRNGDLFFPSEPAVRRFLDLSQVFTEATTPQIRSFLRHRLFAVADMDALLRIADKWTRRKIASIDARGIVASMKPAAVVRVGKDFGVHVVASTVRGSKVLHVPETKAELKDFLRLLDQDFLKSSLTPDRFRVNSKKKLKSPAPGQ